MAKQTIAIIGAGFAGLSAACCLAKEGHEVTVLEKNAGTGGRARKLETDGFTFDIGPSWYWMPDVFETFFARFNASVSTQYELTRLDPSYKIFFPGNEEVPVPASLNQLSLLFESMEKGAGSKLEVFLAEAKLKYELGMKKMVYSPGLSLNEYLHPQLLKSALKLSIFNSFHHHARRYFKDERLLQLLEFPILFLGALPQNTPALYSLMNYADMELGTWYPKGGMYRVVEAMERLALSLGVKIRCNAAVKELEVTQSRVRAVHTENESYSADVVLANADYHHVEQLLPGSFRNYTESYWRSRTFAPSCLIFLLGISKKLKNIEHHNLFFDEDFKEHAKALYVKPDWPANPLFYMSCTSKTDPSVAPPQHENLFILIPVAPGLEDNGQIRDHYYRLCMERLEKITRQAINDHVVFKQSYACSDFKKDYNAYQGNAYGLANTLGQTGIFKPKIINRRLKNLFYTGQLTVPGPGVPPAIISGQIVAHEIIQSLKKKKYESIV